MALSTSCKRPFQEKSNLDSTNEDVKSQCRSYLEEYANSSKYGSDLIPPTEAPLYTAMFKMFENLPVPIENRERLAYSDKLWKDFSHFSSLYSENTTGRPKSPASNHDLKNLFKFYVTLLPQTQIEGASDDAKYTYLLENNELGKLVSLLKSSNSVAYDAHLSRVLPRFQSSRGASYSELLVIYLLANHGKDFFFHQGQVASEIFTNKTTPSLVCNNEAAGAIAPPIPWKNLGMAHYQGFGYVSNFHGPVAKFKFENPVIASFIPVFGTVMSAGDRLIEAMEQGQSGNYGASAAKSIGFLFDFALAGIELTGVRVSAANGASVAAKVASEIRATERSSEGLKKVLKLLRSHVNGGLVRPTEINLTRANASLQKVNRGVALSEDEALELAAAGISGSKGKLYFNAKLSIDEIWMSKRIWGTSQTQSVFATQTPISWSWLRTVFTAGSNNSKMRRYLLIFQGDAARYFKPHPVYGPISGLQRVTGEFVSEIGDLIIERAVRSGNSIVITDVRLATAAELAERGKTTGGMATYVRNWRWRVEPAISLTIASPAAAAIGMHYMTTEDIGENYGSEGPSAEGKILSVIKTEGSTLERKQE